MDAAAALQPVSAEPAWAGRGDGGPTGKIVWRYRAGVFESSPLVVGKTLYVGSWDYKLHAINIYTGKAC